MCIDVNFPQCQCRNCSYPWFVNSYVMPILHNSTSGIVGFYQIITMLGTPRSFIDHVYENPGLEMRIYNLLILFQGNPLVFHIEIHIHIHEVCTYRYLQLAQVAQDKNEKMSQWPADGLLARMVICSDGPRYHQ